MLPDTFQAPGPEAPSGAPPEPPRRALVAALLIVGVLSAAALFASGYTLGQRGSGSPPGADEALAPLLETYRRISTEYVGETTPGQLVEGAIRGMFEVLEDPYSSYMTQREYEDSLAGISGEFEGIGAEMTTQDPRGEPCQLAGPDCLMRVLHVLGGSPAERAGLLEGDVVRSVDGRAVEGEDLGAVIRRIRGPRGSAVTLTLRRGDEDRELIIVRDVIRAQSVDSEVIAEGSVAYLRVEGFGGRTAEEFRQALQGHLDGGIERVVVDLRDDPGGFVDAAVTIASQFVASGPIYWEEDAEGRQLLVAAEAGGVATDPRVRVVVLVNGGTASASEIVAGALQDSGRATVIGETTFGKGSIQQWHLLPGDRGGIRISVARWLTPDRSSIDGAGIEPDVVVEDGGRARGGDGDVQLQEGIRLLLDEAEQATSRAAAA